MKKLIIIFLFSCTSNEVVEEKKVVAVKQERQVSNTQLIMTAHETGYLQGYAACKNHQPLRRSKSIDSLAVLNIIK